MGSGRNEDQQKAANVQVNTHDVSMHINNVWGFICVQN